MSTLTSRLRSRSYDRRILEAAKTNCNSDGLFVRLFHGRKHPGEELSDWGFDGPIIGPVGVSMTFGTLKLHCPGWLEQEELPMYDGLVFLNDGYYGDMEVSSAHDPALFHALEAGSPLWDWFKFRKHREAAMLKIAVTHATDS